MAEDKRRVVGVNFLLSLWEAYLFRGVARILGKGVLEYARKARTQNFKPRPLINHQGQSLNCQREHVLNVASELAHCFRPNLRMK